MAGDLGSILHRADKLPLLFGRVRCGCSDGERGYRGKIADKTAVPSLLAVSAARPGHHPGFRH